MSKKAPVDTPVEEYGSITLVHDHLVEDRQEGDAVVLKTVFSNQTAAEALLAQVAYFGMHGLLMDKAVRDMVAVGETQDVLYVLSVPENGAHRAHAQIIVDLPLMSRYLTDSDVNPDGTLMGAHQAILMQAATLLAKAREADEGLPVALFIPEE